MPRTRSLRSFFPQRVLDVELTRIFYAKNNPFQFGVYRGGEDLNNKHPPGGSFKGEISADRGSWCPTGPVETTMSSFLPPEIFYLIVDHLYDEQTTLRVCCLLSKSWIWRTRRHIFAHVEFEESGFSIGPGSSIASWKKAFPDPSNSPAYHTHGLKIYGLNTCPVQLLFSLKGRELGGPERD
jgi:hypothetical protein